MRLIRAQLPRVHLDTQMPPEGNAGAKFQSVLATRGVAYRRTDVTTHQFRRQDLAKTALDTQSVKGVIAVRGPEAAYIRQDAKIHPATPRSTALYLDVGKTLPDFCQQAIKCPRLPVHRVLARGITRLMNIPVHIPFEVADIVVTQQCGYRRQ